MDPSGEFFFLSCYLILVLNVRKASWNIIIFFHENSGLMLNKIDQLNKICLMRLMEYSCNKGHTMCEVDVD